MLPIIMPGAITLLVKNKLMSLSIQSGGCLTNVQVYKDSLYSMLLEEVHIQISVGSNVGQTKLVGSKFGIFGGFGLVHECEAPYKSPAV